MNRIALAALMLSVSAAQSTSATQADYCCTYDENSNLVCECHPLYPGETLEVATPEWFKLHPTTPPPMLHTPKLWQMPGELSAPVPWWQEELTP